MALQFIVQDVSRDWGLRDDLFSLDKHIEYFALDGDDVGVSVPTKVLDRLGEVEIFSLLSRYRYYDLYAAAWHIPEAPVKGRRSRWFGRP